MTVEGIDHWIKEIDYYREQGCYVASDHIRDRLEKEGVIVENKRDGTSRWRYK